MTDWYSRAREEDGRTDDEVLAALPHVASPGFLWTGSTGKTEKCRTCKRYLRHSSTSSTGWRHSGATG